MYKTEENKNLYEAMQSLYERYGYYLEKVTSVTFEGFSAKADMAKVMADLRADPPAEVGLPVRKAVDYLDGEAVTGLPESDVLYYHLAEGCSAIVRPSGTEPKVKLYVMVQGKDREEAEKRFALVQAAGEALLS